MQKINIFRARKRIIEMETAIYVSKNRRTPRTAHVSATRLTKSSEKVSTFYPLSQLTQTDQNKVPDAI